MSKNNVSDPLSKEAMESLQTLGQILNGIHRRMLSEGWKINLKTGEFISPEEPVSEIGISTN